MLVVVVHSDFSVTDGDFAHGIGSGDWFSSEYSGTVAVRLSSLRGNAENRNAGCSCG